MSSLAELVCPVCGGYDIILPRSRYWDSALTPDDFKITDAGYGRTGPLHRCNACSFRFVVFPEHMLQQQSVVQQYERMQDPEYERGRAYRSIQQQKLLARVRRELPDSRTLLDVGAGTGMLLEEAQRQGFERAVGIEPSSWAVEVARARGLDVFPGVLPHPALSQQSFDVITLVDVVEHVDEPIGLLRQCAQALAPTGRLLVVTPDVGSVVARTMGGRWWHYRMAHIGYFDAHTLRLALARAGLRVISLRRPSWYFEASYLYHRLGQYLPLPSIERPPPALRRLMGMHLPLNFFDSIECLACKV